MAGVKEVAVKAAKKLWTHFTEASTADTSNSAVPEYRCVCEWVSVCEFVGCCFTPD